MYAEPRETSERASLFVCDIGNWIYDFTNTINKNYENACGYQQDPYTDTADTHYGIYYKFFVPLSFPHL